MKHEYSLDEKLLQKANKESGEVITIAFPSGFPVFSVSSGSLCSSVSLWFPLFSSVRVISIMIANIIDGSFTNSDACIVIA